MWLPGARRFVNLRHKERRTRRGASYCHSAQREESLLDRKCVVRVGILHSVRNENFLLAFLPSLFASLPATNSPHNHLINSSNRKELTLMKLPGLKTIAVFFLAAAVGSPAFGVNTALPGTIN